MVDFRLQYGKSLSRKSKIISVNRSLEDLNKNTDMFWKPAVKANCDACEFAMKLAEKFNAKTDWSSWIEGLKEAELKREENNRKSSERPSKGHGDLDQQKLLNPLALCYEVDRFLGSEPKGKSHDVKNTPSLMIGDGGDFVACAAYVFFFFLCFFFYFFTGVSFIIISSLSSS